MNGSRKTFQVAYWSAMRAGGSLLYASWKLWMASPICLRLLAHCVRAAASRTFCTAGSSNPIRIAMMAMTTRSSMSVNPRRRFVWRVTIRYLPMSGNDRPIDLPWIVPGLTSQAGRRHPAADAVEQQPADAVEVAEQRPPAGPDLPHQLVRPGLRLVAAADQFLVARG